MRVPLRSGMCAFSVCVRACGGGHVTCSGAGPPGGTFDSSSCFPRASVSADFRWLTSDSNDQSASDLRSSRQSTQSAPRRADQIGYRHCPAGPDGRPWDGSDSEYGMANVLLKLAGGPRTFTRLRPTFYNLPGSSLIPEVQTNLFHAHAALLNSNRSSVVRCGRQKYERQYPVMLVRPDGSTINIRYKEPRRILQMPINVLALSEEERRSRQKKKEVRAPKSRTAGVQEDDFRVERYSHLWKKK
uniref:Mitochondrial ribosomal protein L55 n=2 Tax=Oryzias latipes TaxID=8090 RepID=A0A3B3I423_ORYLA